MNDRFQSSTASRRISDPSVASLTSLSSNNRRGNQIVPRQQARREILSPSTRRLVYKPEVLRRVGCSYPTLWRWMRAGKFPRGRIVGQRTAWLEEEVDDWLNSLQHRPLKGDDE